MVAKSKLVPKPNIGGRPRAIDKESIAKLEMAFSIGAQVLEACHAAGISKSLYYKYCKENPLFQEHMESLRLNPQLKARKVVFDNLNDPKVSMWYLERKCKDEFSTKTEFDGTVKIKEEAPDLEWLTQLRKDLDIEQ